MTGASSQPGPLRRRANIIIALFLLIHVVVVVRAAAPLPDRARAPWPWGMFSFRVPWERDLRATGIDRSGARHELPLDRIFGYTDGATGLYAYHHLAYLDDPARTAAQAAFAAYLARRMAELDVELSAVDLRWVGTNLETGQTAEQVIGTFDVSAPP
jgi:hypothetical protein